MHISRFPDSDANRQFIGMKNLAGRINNCQEQQGGIHDGVNLLENIHKINRSIPDAEMGSVTRALAFGPLDSFTYRICCSTSCWEIVARLCYSTDI